MPHSLIVNDDSHVAATRTANPNDDISRFPIGEWNTFHIKMIGDRVTVLLNGILVVDNVTMENY